MFHVYWPATACLTLILILGVIMAMLRWGPKLCRTRHTTLAPQTYWQHRTYEQSISSA